MNPQRAKEISESPDMKNVFYQGVPIYIQQVDLQNETARVYSLDNPENEWNVSVNELTEQDY